jgi:two-component system response regulator PilR (NtrC family)
MARVLVIDDEMIILEMLRVLLASDGHEVVAISDGNKALDLLSDDEPFDLVITDLRMAPVNGVEILEKAHTARPQLPSIVVSAYFSDENVAKVEALGCRSFVKKPFGIDDILAAIREALGAETEIGSSAV